MRKDLPQPNHAPEHAGLFHERWTPAKAASTSGDKNEAADRWLDKLESTRVSPDYRQFFERWRASFDGNARTACVELQSRMLLGHGNPSGSDVGLTLHHTWGVPMIPGSALKGLLAHRFDILYGPEGDADDDPQRAGWRGVTWNGNAIARGPGRHYRSLFGAPDAAQDQADLAAGRPAGASAGLVCFHDALYVPDSGAPGDRPFARDVLTVHQKSYYDGAGKDWPNDWDSPNPVGFISVRSRVRLWIALTCRDGAWDWADLALAELLEGLREWGIGGKISLGYGRLAKVDEGSVIPTLPPRSQERSQPALSPVLDEFKSVAKGWSVAELVDRVPGEWRERLLGMDGASRRQAANLIVGRVNKKRLERYPSIVEIVEKLRS